MKNNINEDALKNIMVFLAAACEAVENCLNADFICPLCGGTAHASKSEYNGHRSAYCDGCDANFIE
nr:hypothetical protein [uncultured Blautia sp.]